jgi:hypothetical protein
LMPCKTCSSSFASIESSTIEEQNELKHI